MSKLCRNQSFLPATMTVGFNRLKPRGQFTIEKPEFEVHRRIKYAYSNFEIQYSWWSRFRCQIYIHLCYVSGYYIIPNKIFTFCGRYNCFWTFCLLQQKWNEIPKNVVSIIFKIIIHWPRLQHFRFKKSNALICSWWYDKILHSMGFKAVHECKIDLLM